MRSDARPHATFDARRRGVLAFTCAIHLLALFLWTQERRLLPVRPPEVATILLQTDRGVATRPPPDAAPVPLPMPAAPAMPPVPVLAPQAEPVHRRDDEEVPATTAPAAPATPDAAALRPNPIDAAQPAAPPTDARGGFALGLAKQQAGRIDRELRKGKPGVPTEADTPSARFERGLEAAHIDRSLTLQSDTYTSPDGVVIYRFRQGGRVRCRRAGSVGIPLRGMPAGADTMATVGSASASATACPKDVEWKSDGP
jgi:hypothetical protein